MANATVDSKMDSLTKREKEILGFVPRSMKFMPEMDYEKLAQACNMANADSAKDAWAKIAYKIWSDLPAERVAVALDNKRHRLQRYMDDESDDEMPSGGAGMIRPETSGSEHSMSPEKKKQQRYRNYPTAKKSTGGNPGRFTNQVHHLPRLTANQSTGGRGGGPASFTNELHLIRPIVNQSTGGRGGSPAIFNNMMKGDVVDDDDDDHDDVMEADAGTDKPEDAAPEAHDNSGA